MIVRFLLISAAALASASPLFAQVQSNAGQSSAPQNIDRTTQAEDLKVRTDAYERMTVPVRVSGSGPYRFLVDTGADRTAISRELAAHLNLTTGREVELHTTTGASQVSTATIPEIQLTRKAVKGIEAPLLDSVNIGADGILGTDSLSLQRVEFDFKAQTMSVVPAGAPDFADEPGTIVVEARRRNGRLIVTDATANGRHITVVVDTGSQVTIGNEALRRTLQAKDLLPETHPVDLISVTGEHLAGDYMFLKNLEMGGVGLTNLAVVFAPAHTFHQLKLDDKPALLLGMNAMRAFKKVSIDFASRRMRVIVPQTSELQTEFASRPWFGVPAVGR
ncbi:MAG TPA: aspartyl protease family protein [Sphingomicrobium sp.]|nr:aspartyl protease family protein [Sphingomicrobium sp.]